MTVQTSYRCALAACLLSTPTGVASAQALNRPLQSSPLQLEAPPVRSEPAPVGIRSLQLPDGDTSGPPRGGEGSGRTVISRRRPDYDPVGLQLGSFRLLPSVQMRSGYDSNVFAQPGANSDVYGALLGQALLHSQWSRNEVSLDGFVSERVYANSASENGFTYRAHGLGRLDIARQSSLSVDLNQERVFLRRGATAEILATRRPTRYQLSSAALTYRQGLNRLSADVSTYYGHYNYENAETPNGAPLDFSFRDYDLYRGAVELRYATGAGPIFFASATADSRRYNKRGLVARDSDGIEVLAGVTGEISPLIRGRLGIGYIQTDFSDPSIKSRGRVSFDVNLNYLVTELTTFNLSGRRYFSNVSAINAPSGLTTEVSLGADHELLRNLILSASTTYRQTDYVSIDAQAHSWALGGGARLLLTRQLRADATVEYRDRKGRPRLLPVDYSEVEASVGITFSL